MRDVNKEGVLFDIYKYDYRTSDTEINILKIFILVVCAFLSTYTSIFCAVLCLFIT